MMMTELQLYHVKGLNLSLHYGLCVNAYAAPSVCRSWCTYKTKATYSTDFI